MEHGFKWTKATKKPLMKPANMQTSRNSDLPGSTNSTADDWKRVLWTDESKFELFGQHHVCPQRSWRTFWWQMHCTHSETQWRFSSGMEFHLWKWHEKISENQLYHEQEHLPQHLGASQSLLFLIWLVTDLYTKKNDPKHTSKLCRDHLYKKRESGVKVQICLWLNKFGIW